MKNKFLRDIIVCGFLVLFCFSSSPAFARAVNIVTNSIKIVNGGANANNGTAVLNDTNTGQVWNRPITNGQITPGDSSVVANDVLSGSFSLTLTAPDSNAPDGPKDRRNVLSQSYTAMGEPVDFPVSTWLVTILDTPPPPTVKAAGQSGFDLDLYPRVDLEIELASALAGPFTVNYDQNYYPFTGFHYEITNTANQQKKSGNITAYSLNGTAKNAKISLTDQAFFPKNAANNYSVIAYAYNNTYTLGHGGNYTPRWSSPPVLFTTSVAPAGGTLDLGTITLRNGINFISMPFNRKEGQIEWYAYDGTGLPPYPPINFKNGQNKIETPRDLILAINELAKQYSNGLNVVSTFGRWQNQDAGVLVPEKNLAKVVDPAQNQKLDDNALIIAEEGYQVYISGLINPPNGVIILKVKSSVQ